MSYWVKRIILKSGEIVTEKELPPDQNRFYGKPPVVGDEIFVRCRGRSFKAEVIWGSWHKTYETYNPNIVVPLRVKEL